MTSSGTHTDGETYAPTDAEYEYGLEINQYAKEYGQARPVMPVYHDGRLREVYTDTWTLVPLRANHPPSPRLRRPNTQGHVAHKRGCSSSRLGVCDRCKEEKFMTMHHVVHRSRGGGGGSNLQPLCWPCHCYAHNVLNVPSGTRVPSLVTMSG